MQAVASSTCTNKRGSVNTSGCVSWRTVLKRYAAKLMQATKDAEHNAAQRRIMAQDEEKTAKNRARRQKKKAAMERAKGGAQHVERDAPPIAPPQRIPATADTADAAAQAPPRPASDAPDAHA